MALECTRCTIFHGSCQWYWSLSGGCRSYRQVGRL